MALFVCPERYMEQIAEQQTPDPFDAAVSTSSNYVEPAATKDAPVGAEKVDDAATPEPPKDAQKAEERRPTNAEARKDPQARIRQQAWDQREAERRAEAAEQRAEAAERREQERAREQTAAKPPEPQAPPTPQTDKFPDYATYLQSNPDASLEAWMDARDEWRDARRDAQLQERAALQQAETTFHSKASAFGERFAAAAKTDPELEQRIDRELLNVRPYSTLTPQDKALIRNIPDPAARDLVAFRCFLADQWIDSEHAVELLEHLSDPKEFQRLATLPPNQVIRALAKIEAGFSAAPGKDRGPAPKPSASQANAPIKPLGTSPQGATDEGSDDEPFEAFIRRENARDRKAGRL
jgi:hypothetical protein